MSGPAQCPIDYPVTETFTIALFEGTKGQPEVRVTAARAAELGLTSADADRIYEECLQYAKAIPSEIPPEWAPFSIQAVAYLSRVRKHLAERGPAERLVLLFGLQCLVAVPEENLDRIAEVATLLCEKERGAHVMLLVEDTLNRWLPPQEHAAFDAVMKARMAEIRRQYQLQELALLAKYPDAYVGDLGLMSVPGFAIPMTLAVWGKGPHLLARADVLALGKSFLTKPVFTNFDDGLKYLGHLMKSVEGFDPPRWLVTDFPTADELAKLPKYEGPAALYWVERILEEGSSP